jgi:hypothetical protein
MLLALGGLAVGLALVSHPLINAFPYGLTDDDAWFYTRIAYELGTTGRPTFDGIHLTSGFHLLWGGLLGLTSAAVGVVSTAPLIHLYAHETVYLFLALLIARVFAVRVIDQIVLFGLTIVSTMLMETLLVGTLLLVFLRLSADGHPSPSRARLALIALALLPLARIDAVVVPLTLAATLLMAGRRREAIRVGAATAVGTIVQMAIMLIIFGHVFSVSSQIKATSVLPGTVTFVGNLLGPESLSVGFLLRALIFFLLAAAVFIWPRKAFVGRTQALGIAAGVCVFTLGHLAAHRIPFWYYLPAYLVLYYLVTQQNGDNAVRRLTPVVMMSLIVVFLTHKLIDFNRHRSVVDGARDFVGRLAAAVPSNARIYQVDGTGFVGFFSGRTVVDGDGLVNTIEYTTRARRGGLAGYLDEEGICFVIDNVNRGASDVIVNYGGLMVRRGDIKEVLRTKTYGQHPTTDFVLYRRRTEGCSMETPSTP